MYVKKQPKPSKNGQKAMILHAFGVQATDTNSRRRANAGLCLQNWIICRDGLRGEHIQASWQYHKVA